ncbi:GTP-binding protein [Patescibacteria group bacterium]|nr:GTP-binding protein [Patescibacteria group bacterium]
MKKTDLHKIDLAAKITRLEEEIRKTPYHKGTEHYIGKLRAKIAKLKKQEEQSHKSGSRFGFIPRKEGDATVVLIGPPSVGKSTLLNKLSQAHARVEAWPFTTLTVIPGMWDYQGAKIQIFDLPGIVKGAAIGVGRGREVLSVARIADLLILMVDVKTKNQIENILKELKLVGVDLPILTVINKIDLIGETNRQNDLIFISAEHGIGLEDLKKKIWEKLRLMRIYLKKKGQEPDFDSPLILKEEQKIKDVVEKIFPEDREIKQILLWGSSARFPGQQVSLSHQLQDEDILNFS